MHEVLLCLLMSFSCLCNPCQILNFCLIYILFASIFPEVMEIALVVPKVVDFANTPKVIDFETYEFHHCFCGIENKDVEPHCIATTLLAIFFLILSIVTIRRFTSNSLGYNSCGA